MSKTINYTAEPKIEKIVCISPDGMHKFKVLTDIKEQTYYHENGKVRDFWINRREHLVCEICGIDSELFNNPKWVAVGGVKHFDI